MQQKQSKGISCRIDGTFPKIRPAYSSVEQSVESFVEAILTFEEVEHRFRPSSSSSKPTALPREIFAQNFACSSREKWEQFHSGQLDP